MLSRGYIAQWLERLTADQQVPGSNPGVPLPGFSDHEAPEYGDVLVFLLMLQAFKTCRSLEIMPKKPPAPDDPKDLCRGSGLDETFS